MRLTLFICLMLFVVPPAMAERETVAISLEGDMLAAGHALAHKACGACHVTDPAQKEQPPVRAILHARPAGNMEVRIPTFVEIAARPGMNAQSLHRFIESTHWEKNTVPASAMPQPPVTRDQEAKIIAYLLSLKKVPKP